MSFSLFNQDTDLKEGPSPYPLPQERDKEADLPEIGMNGPHRHCPHERDKEADLPEKGGARPESKGEKDFLSWGRG
jgi:hypothetical protein